MAGKRPEGLSPSYGSIVSSDIPESFQLSWVFVPSTSTSKQTQAVVKIYPKGSNTATITQTVTGTTTSFDLSTVTLSDDTSYEWTVQPTDSNQGLSTVSKRAEFKNVAIPQPDPVIWSSGPEAYEALGARTYFDLIKSNALLIMEDYKIDSQEEIKLANKITENLFVGDIVPYRDDYTLLEEILKLISTKEQTLPPEVVKIIEDGLGASDIHKIYEFFNSLTMRAPQPVGGVNITIPTIPMYQMTEINVISSGKEDTTIDVNWKSGAVANDKGTISILSPSPSEDTSYYECDFRYGPKNNPYSAKLFFRPSDLAAKGYKIEFDLDFDLLYTAQTLSQAEEYFRIKTVDVRGNRSDWAFKYVTHGSGFKTPLGIGYYEVMFEKAALSASGPNPNARWYDLYMGTGLSTVHRLDKGQDGMYFYCVRGVDISGLTTSWKYSTGNKFDPLMPPPPPKNLRLIYSDTSTLQWQWDRSPTADGYNVSFPTDNYSGGPTTDDKWWKGSLGEGAWHEIRVQAYNRAGTSSWVGMWSQTKTRPPVWSPEIPLWAECWRTAYTINGGRSWNAAEWRVENWDVARFECIQGMWIELRDGYNTDGRWVKKGTTYGNHKSLIFTDRNYWKNLLAGKEILDIQIYMKRKSSSHGYPNDGRFLHFWTHNYNGVPWGQEPWLGNPRTVWENFERGEGKWIKLPIEYAHMLQRGEIGGFALHSDFRYADNPDKYTYLRFEENMKLSIRYK